MSVTCVGTRDTVVHARPPATASTKGASPIQARLGTACRRRSARSGDEKRRSARAKYLRATRAQQRFDRVVAVPSEESAPQGSRTVVSDATVVKIAIATPVVR